MADSRRRCRARVLLLRLEELVLAQDRQARQRCSESIPRIDVAKQLADRRARRAHDDLRLQRGSSEASRSAAARFQASNGRCSSMRSGGVVRSTRALLVLPRPARSLVVASLLCCAGVSSDSVESPSPRFSIA